MTRCGLWFPVGANNDKEEDTTEVVLRFLRTELLNDIRDYAYSASHAVPEEEEHVRHMIADIGEETGGLDRVSRVLTLTHATINDLLSPLTHQDAAEGNYDDKLEPPREYSIVLHLSKGTPESRVQRLRWLIHELLVLMSLAEWLRMIAPKFSQYWQERVMELRPQLDEATGAQTGGYTRPLQPF